MLKPRYQSMLATLTLCIWMSARHPKWSTWPISSTRNMTKTSWFRSIGPISRNNISRRRASHLMLTSISTRTFWKPSLSKIIRGSLRLEKLLCWHMNKKLLQLMCTISHLSCQLHFLKRGAISCLRTWPMSGPSGFKNQTLALRC